MEFLDRCKSYWYYLSRSFTSWSSTWRFWSSRPLVADVRLIILVYSYSPNGSYAVDCIPFHQNQNKHWKLTINDLVWNLLFHNVGMFPRTFIMKRVERRKMWMFCLCKDDLEWTSLAMEERRPRTTGLLLLKVGRANQILLFTFLTYPLKKVTVSKIAVENYSQTWFPHLSRLKLDGPRG